MLLCDGLFTVLPGIELARIVDTKSERDLTVMEGQRIDVQVGPGQWLKGYYVPLVSGDDHVQKIPYGQCIDFNQMARIDHIWYQWEYSSRLKGIFMQLTQAQRVRLYTETHNYAHSMQHNR